MSKNNMANESNFNHTKYITKEQLNKMWNDEMICIEFSDGSDVIAQENGYTLEQCLEMDDVKFFLDR